MDTTVLCDEEYIDMELCSSPQNREFEFQMSTACSDKQNTTSPADELFYKGKLLPLHLPPRRLMLQNLLLTKDHYPSSTNTPLDSCNISPSESRRVSCELDPDDYFFEWSSELNTFINNHPTKLTWSKKLTLVKNSILGMSLKTSRTYLKSFFTKSSCSKNKTFRHIDVSSMKNNIDKEGRRSFSSAIKRHSPKKCSSSSSSNSSSSSSSLSLHSNDLHLLRRRSSATEIEGSIQAAIAHCKKSHQILHSTNSSGICSLIGDEEDQKRPVLFST